MIRLEKMTAKVGLKAFWCCHSIFYGSYEQTERSDSLLLFIKIWNRQCRGGGDNQRKEGKLPRSGFVQLAMIVNSTILEIDEDKFLKSCPF